MKSRPPKRYRYIAAAALCLLVSAPVFAGTTEDRWTRIQSRNFLLVGDASEKDIRKVAARLEQFREAFVRLLSLDHFDSSVPMTFIVFKTLESYRPFEPLYQGQPAAVAGFFQSNPDVDYITLSVDRRHVRDADALAFHEYAHLLIRSSFPNAPLWFNEGLAEYYSTFNVSHGDRRVTLGKPIGNRVQTLRDSKLLPLDVLFKVDTTSANYNEKNKRNLFYAESWALVHYLLSGPRRAQLTAYLNLLAKGTTVADAFQQAFQTSFTGMETELAQYIRLKKFPEQVITFDERLERDPLMQSSVLTGAEAHYYLGDLLLHTNRIEAAESYLQSAVALEPELATAQASLGMLRMRQSRFEEAKQHLERASAKSDNYLVHYYYAYVLSHEGLGSEDSIHSYYDDEKTSLMRAELKKTIELAPNFAEGYRLLAFINLVRDEYLQESIALVRKAMELSPKKQHLALLLAQIHLRREEFSTARTILDRVIGTGVTPKVQGQVQALLTRVAATEEFVARVNALNAATLREEAPPGIVQPCDAPQPGPQLKKLRFAGEQICGRLIQVECAEDGVILSVEAGEKTFKLHSEQLNRIRFVTYTSDVKGQVTCGLRVPANQVLVTYRPSKLKGEIHGEAIAVEFVPREWNANH